MTVTGIEQLGRGRYCVFLDGEAAFTLYKGELKSYGIKQDCELSEESYELIMSVALTKRARLRAMNLLMKKSYTSMQLQKKFAASGYPEAIITDALEYVISFGYVDDEAYARDYIRCHLDDKSMRRIKYDLMNKGVSQDIIEEALCEAAMSGDGVDEEGQICKLLKKRGYNCCTASYEERQKACAYLVRKGYSTELVMNIVRVYE